jgi:ATP-binding protein involved in chromosome partitioning
VPTDTAVVDALRPVQDPAVPRSIVDLGLVRAVNVSRGRVHVVVGLAAGDEPAARELRRRVIDAVGGIDGVDRVEVDLEALDEGELEALAERLRPAVPGAPPGAPRVNPFAEGSTRIIAIASGKGGVGKSSVTANLAVALAQTGRRVGVLDADVWGFSLPRMLGVDRSPTVIGDLVVPPEAHGVRVVSMGFFAREDQPVIWRGPMLHKALEQFLTDVFWDEPDLLLVDLPPGTGDVSISMAQFLARSEVVIVTTPQPAAQKVAQRAAYMAKKVNLAVVGVVENMSWFRGDDGTAYEIFGRGGGQTLADELQVPLLGQVPLVTALREGGDTGQPIVASDPGHEAAEVFRRVADRIVTELAPRKIFRRELKII